MFLVTFWFVVLCVTCLCFAVTMAEQFFSTALKEVIQEIRMQNLTKHVRPFHGEGSAKFRNWLTDMDQLGITVDSERMCVLASLTLGGLAGTFVSRF